MITITAAQYVRDLSVGISIGDEYGQAIQNSCPRSDWNFTPPQITVSTVGATVIPAQLLGCVSVDKQLMDYYVDGSFVGGNQGAPFQFVLPSLSTTKHGQSHILSAIQQVPSGCGNFVGDFIQSDSVIATVP
jgi:hypothetical protein